VYYDVLKVVDARVWKDPDYTYTFFCFVLSKYPDPSVSGSFVVMIGAKHAWLTRRRDLK
jgi:hypothetical protein